MTHLGFTLLYTPDVPAKIGFYERAFAMEKKFVTDDAGYGEMAGVVPLCFASEAMAARGVGEVTPARPGAPPAAVELGFVVEDVGAAYRRAVAAGAVAHRPPEEKPWGQIVAYVRDLDGVLVELCTAWTT
jgi:lactoylglutathione lyase